MSSGPYTLYYWPLAGRGEFVRLILEEAGVKYKEVNDGKILKDNIIGNTHGGYPVFAPPMIKCGGILDTACHEVQDSDFNISQTPVICRYLGKKYGMWPSTDEDEWHAEQVNTTIHDFVAEGRLVFHARCYTESYYTQKDETAGHIAWFKEGRLQRWLGHLEAVLAANNGGNGFVVGEKLTYVDLALLHVLRATASQFPEEWKKLDTVPLLKAFKDRLSARPNLQAYFKSDRCRAFEGNSMM